MNDHTVTLPRPVDPVTDDDDWAHFFCTCDPDRAFCGVDLAGVPEATCIEDGESCPLCLVLCRANGWVCARCGR